MALKSCLILREEAREAFARNHFASITFAMTAYLEFISFITLLCLTIG
jgi:hypothetical protein